MLITNGAGEGWGGVRPFPRKWEGGSRKEMNEVKKREGAKERKRDVDGEKDRAKSSRKKIIKL